jgi:gliding motility-associated-like protein
MCVKNKIWSAAVVFLVVVAGVQAQFQLNGSATLFGTDCYRLTPASLNVSGSIWNLAQINLNNSFDMEFDVFLGCSNNPGADGFVFGLQPISTFVGTTGAGMGFGGIAPSIGVEFDTYPNGDFADPVFDHIAIVRNGNMNHNITASTLAGPVQCSATSQNVEDCAYHIIRIVWDPSTKTMQVYFDCTLRLTLTNDIVANTFNGNPNVYWGFTAATGGEVNEHRVCPKYFSFNDSFEDQNICVGGSIALQAPAANAQTYTWVPATGLSNPNIASPIATPTVTTTYIVSCLLGCNQTVNDTITVFVNQLDGVGIDQDNQTICAGTSLTLTTTAPATATYQWSNGGQTPTLLVNASGTYTVTITDGLCSGTDQVEIFVLPTPNSFLPPDQSFCNGDTLIIPLPPNITDIDVTWNGQPVSGDIVVSETGNYTLVMSSQNGNCTATDDISVVFADVPVVNLDNQAICQGQAANLNAFYPGATYEWSTGSTDAILQVGTPGTFEVTVTLDNCTYETSADVTIQELPQVFFPNDTLICLGGYIELYVVGDSAVVVWQDGSNSLTYTITEAGVYGVVAQNGCGTVIESIVVNTEDCLRLYIPNSFSPNDDGVNDTFGPGFSSNVVVINSMVIFDRWGNKIFENTDFVPGQPPVEWDGTFRGALAPTGTYAFVIEATFREGSRLTFSGDLTLIR